MTEQNSRATLYAKLARVMGEIGELEKRGYNENFRYQFIRDADVANALRPLLAREGVAILVGMEKVQQEPITSGSGATGYHTVAHLNITFADSETGATVTVPWYGEANDYQDKGVNKCATAGLKYALLKTFLIGSDDDPDAVSTSAASVHRGNGGSVEVDLSTTVNFGKHKDETLADILESDPGYIEYLAREWKWDRGRAMAQALIAQMDESSTVEQATSDSENGTPTGSKTATDFWTLAKRMITQRDGFTSDIANAIKDNHQGPDGVDWDAAYAEMENWTSENDIPF